MFLKTSPNTFVCVLNIDERSVDFFIRCCIVNILGFQDQNISVATTQKAGTGNQSVNLGVAVTQ